jgi:hypothetical protein
MDDWYLWMILAVVGVGGIYVMWWCYQVLIVLRGVLAHG